MHASAAPLRSAQASRQARRAPVTPLAHSRLRVTSLACTAWSLTWGGYPPDPPPPSGRRTARATSAWAMPATGTTAAPLALARRAPGVAPQPWHPRRAWLQHRPGALTPRHHERGVPPAWGAVVRPGPAVLLAGTRSACPGKTWPGSPPPPPAAQQPVPGRSRGGGGSHDAAAPEASKARGTPPGPPATRGVASAYRCTAARAHLAGRPTAFPAPRPGPSPGAASGPKPDPARKSARKRLTRGMVPPSVPRVAAPAAEKGALSRSRRDGRTVASLSPRCTAGEASTPRAAGRSGIRARRSRAVAGAP